MASVIRIKPLQYIHVLDHNAGCTRLVNGPCTFTRQEHEKVLCQPRNFEIVPPRHYCVISNPIQTDASGGPKASLIFSAIFMCCDVVCFSVRQQWKLRPIFWRSRDSLWRPRAFPPVSRRKAGWRSAGLRLWMIS